MQTDDYVGPSLPHRIVALPDIDDRSINMNMNMNHVSEYIEYTDYDIFFSSLSDSFVITGGLAYVALSLWDWIFMQQKHSSYCYCALSLSAPFIYLFNSLVDILWAANAQCQHNTNVLHSILDETTSHDISWWHRTRKHAAYRQTILAALTFCIAAALAVLAAMLRFYVDHQDVHVSTDGLLLDMASDHVYILSAIIAITGKRTRPWLTCSSQGRGCNNNMLNNPEPLKDLGDLLFLMVSLVDGSMWYFQYGKEPVWSFISSLLWILDACLYLRSNLVMAKRAKRKHTKLL
jgi:hypothetical protein